MRAVKGSKTFISSVALGTRGLRVKLNTSTGKLELAGALDRELGTADEIVLAANDPAAVVLPQTDATIYLVAAGAISQYATVYGAASGKVSATANLNPIAIALQAAGADGDRIECVRIPQSGLAVSEAATANRTVLAAESGMIFTNVGASGAVTFALPPATVGLNYKFRVGAAQELRIDPDGTEQISLPSTGVPGAAGKYLVADADGETVNLVCTKTGQWSVFGHTGTWTAEA